MSTRIPSREWPTLGSINSSLVLSTATYCLSSLLLCVRGGLLIFQTGIVRPRPAGARGPKSSGDGLRKVSAELPGLRAEPKSERVYHRPFFNGHQAPGEKSMYRSSDDAVYTAKKSNYIFRMYLYSCDNIGQCIGDYSYIYILAVAFSYSNYAPFSTFNRSTISTVWLDERGSWTPP